jgi:hypothetical protein
VDCLSKARNGEFSGLTLLYTLVRFPVDSPVPFITISGTVWVCLKMLPRFIGYPAGIVIFATGFFLNLSTTLDRIKGESAQKRIKTRSSAATITFSKKSE